MARTRQTRGMSMRTLAQTAEILRVLGHPVRLKLVERLLREPASVGELARQARQSQHAVSQHLGKLYLQGLVSRRREGREVHYSIRDEQLASLMDWIRKRRYGDTTFQGGEAI
ncbi:MAG: ArsR/SmtB family transcription factor [Phycisphaeraceae bacterium]